MVKLGTYNAAMAGDQSQARKNFKTQLFKHGWTVKEVAVKVELSERTLYNWTADANPSNLGSGSLVRLANLFNVDIEEFLGKEGLAGLDEDTLTIDETRDSLLEELRGLIDGIEDENDLIQIGDILKAVARTAKDNYGRQKLVRRRRQLGPLPRLGDAKG